MPTAKHFLALWVDCDYGRRTIINEFADAGNHGRPAANKGKRKDHLRGDAPVQPQEDWPFRVVIEVARTDLIDVSTAHIPECAFLTK